jgi:hypothetical protein
MTAFGQGSFFMPKLNSKETFMTGISKLFAPTKTNTYHET